MMPRAHCIFFALTRILFVEVEERVAGDSARERAAGA